MSSSSIAILLMPAPGGLRAPRYRSISAPQGADFRARYGARRLGRKPSISQRSIASKKDRIKATPSGARPGFRMESRHPFHCARNSPAAHRTRPSVRSAAGLTAAVQHDKFTSKALQDNLGRITLRAILVSPFAGLQLAFQIDFRALAQVLLRDLGKVLVEDHHAVPFGALLALPYPCPAKFRTSRPTDSRSGSPALVRRTSGSLPRLPTRITLFTLPAMSVSAFRFSQRYPSCPPPRHSAASTTCG